MAFRLHAYTHLLDGLRRRGYALGPVRAYYENSRAPTLYLRHDVDRLPGRAVQMARAERARGVRATYYFRCNRRTSFPEPHIREVANLGHEIGFHYETLSRARGDAARAAERFVVELAALRKLAEIRTIAAHGSPFSRLSDHGHATCPDLKTLGLLGESTVDFDFSRVVYITDTGGVFGGRHNRRDWVEGLNLRTPMLPHELERLLTPNAFPLVLLSSHPERWPAGAAGLQQARLMDASTNAMKTALAWLQGRPLSEGEDAGGAGVALVRRREAPLRGSRQEKVVSATQ